MVGYLSLPNLSAMVDMGQEVPAPAFNVDDFTPASASGKNLARLTRSMHMQLAARAKTEGVSLNSLVLSQISVSQLSPHLRMTCLPKAIMWTWSGPSAMRHQRA